MLKLKPHISSGGRTRTLLFLAVVAVVISSLGVATPAPALPVELSYEAEEELEGRAPTAVELTPGVEAAFPRESYAHGAPRRWSLQPRPRTPAPDLPRRPRGHAHRGQRHHERRGTTRGGRRGFQLRPPISANSHRRLADRPLLRAVERRGRPRRPCALRCPAAPSRRAPRRRLPADVDQRGLQPSATWTTTARVTAGTQAGVTRPSSWAGRFSTGASRTTSASTTCRSCTG